MNVFEWRIISLFILVDFYIFWDCKFYWIRRIDSIFSKESLNFLLPFKDFLLSFTKFISRFWKYFRPDLFVVFIYFLLIAVDYWSNILQSPQKTEVSFFYIKKTVLKVDWWISGELPKCLLIWFENKQILYDTIYIDSNSINSHYNNKLQ